ncbi:MAG: ATP-dependent DNA ligase [Acidimicrobiales bacterium]
MPPTLLPMLAGGVGMPRDPTAWLYEPKWDGIRAMVTVSAHNLTVANRRGGDVTAGYPEMAPMAAALAGHAAVLDGEVVTFDGEGRPSFQRLQRRMHVRNPPARLVAEVPVAFVAFDLLWLDGELLVGQPQAQRRRLLEALDLRGPAWSTTPLLADAPDRDTLDACRAAGLEGYMAKRRDAPYQPGRRSPAWSKIKCVRRREFVVGGWSPGQAGRTGSIGSLALGAYDVSPEDAAAAGRPARLGYVGLAGSGLSEELIGVLTTAFARIGRPDSPFAGPVDPGLRFVEPLLVADVAYTEVTESGTLRQPSLKGLRADVDPRRVLADGAKRVET